MFTLSHTSHMHAHPVLFKGGVESQGYVPDSKETGVAKTPNHEYVPGKIDPMQIQKLFANDPTERTRVLGEHYKIAPEFMKYVVSIDQLQTPPDQISIRFQSGYGLAVPIYPHLQSPKTEVQTLTNLRGIKPNNDGTFMAIKEDPSQNIALMRIEPISSKPALQAVPNMPDLGDVMKQFEAGTRAAAAIEQLKKYYNNVGIFLNDANVYNAISLGWKNDQVTPELASWFKENIVKPMYVGQGWDGIKNIPVDTIGVDFQDGKMFVGLKGSRPLPLIVSNINRDGSISVTSTAQWTKFGQRPNPPTQASQSNQQVQPQQPVQAQVAPVYNNTQQNQPRPLTFAEQEMQRQKEYAIKQIKDYIPGGRVDLVSRIWDVRDASGRNYIDLSLQEAFKNKFKNSFYPYGRMKMESPVSVDPNIKVKMNLPMMFLTDFKPDQLGGFTFTEPAYLDRTGKKDFLHNLKNDFKATYRVFPDGQVRLISKNFN